MRCKSAMSSNKISASSSAAAAVGGEERDGDWPSEIGVTPRDGVDAVDASSAATDDDGDRVCLRMRSLKPRATPPLGVDEGEEPPARRRRGRANPLAAMRVAMMAALVHPYHQPCARRHVKRAERYASPHSHVCATRAAHSSSGAQPVSSAMTALASASLLLALLSREVWTTSPLRRLLREGVGGERPRRANALAAAAAAGDPQPPKDVPSDCCCGVPAERRYPSAAAAAAAAEEEVLPVL